MNLTELANAKAPGPTEESRAQVERIRPPNGVATSDWLSMIEFAVQHYLNTAGLGTPSKASLKAYDIDDTIPDKSWDLVFNYGKPREKFMEALAVRGVLPAGRGLTAQQMLAIDILTDPHVSGTWGTKLKKAGITEKQLSLWMETETFSGQFRLITSRRMNQVLPAVDVVLAAKALSGEMDAVKYLDKRMGRDPDKKDEMSSREAVAIVLDSLSKHLAKDHPDILRSIAADIEVRMKLNG